MDTFWLAFFVVGLPAIAIGAILWNTLRGGK